MRIGRVYPVLICFALTCNYVSAWFKTITEKSPVIVAVGDTALLQCRTSIPGELKEVRWLRIQGGRYSLIYLFRNGRAQQRCDLPEYVGRTEVMTEDLAHGRVALKLFHVSVADKGTYRCYLETVDYFDFGDLKLNVTGRINASSEMRKDHVFPVLDFFALVSCDCVLAWFKAIAEESLVAVAVWDTTVLRCRTSIPEELKEVRWIRIQDGRYSIINIFEDGRDQQKCDLPEYIGRTEVMRDGLTHGRAALKLFNVSVAEGTYRCFLRTVNFFDFVNLELRVTALGSHPRIDIEGFQNGGIKVVCKSTGWYPEPRLVNKDDDGEMKIRKEENGFYSIEYFRIITENSNRTFSCLFHTLFPKQEWETSVYVADGLFRKSTDVTTILLALALVGSLAAAIIFGILYTCRRNEQGVSRFGLLFFIKSNLSEAHAIREQLPASVYSSAGDLHTIPSSVTITEVSPKEEPIGCESSPLTQALLPLRPDPEGTSAANT